MLLKGQPCACSCRSNLAPTVATGCQGPVPSRLVPVCCAGHLTQPHWTALLESATDAQANPAGNKKWVSWPRDSGVDLVDLYMYRIKDPSSCNPIECRVQLFDSIAVAALVDILIKKFGYVVREEFLFLAACDVVSSELRPVRPLVQGDGRCWPPSSSGGLWTRPSEHDRHVQGQLDGGPGVGYNC